MEKIKLRIKSFLYFLILLIVGCTTTSRIRPYVVKDNPLDNDIPQGVVFSLPKTLLELKITYSVYKINVWKSDKDGKPIKKDKTGAPVEPNSEIEEIYVEKPIEVSTKTIPDNDMMFVFDTRSLEGFMKDANTTLNLTDYGLIKAANLSVQDKTKEIVADLAATALHVAKIAAVAGEGETRTVAEPVHIKDIVVTRWINPTSPSLEFSQENNMFIAEYDDSKKAEVIFQSGVPPKVAVKFVSAVDMKKLSRMKSASLRKKAGSLKTLPGFPYCVGGVVEVIVTVDCNEVYDNYLMFSQAGGIALLPFETKAFTDAIQGIAFSDDGSSLKSFVSSSTSQGKAMSAMGSDTTEKYLTATTKIQQAILDNLKKQKEIIDAELELQQALKKKVEADSDSPDR